MGVDTKAVNNSAILVLLLIGSLRAVLLFWGLALCSLLTRPICYC